MHFDILAAFLLYFDLTSAKIYSQVYEYIAVNYRGHSPVVGLLHSIMGVGTNIFPMEASKIPALKAMLTPTEWTHTQAFPTVIRVLNGGMLLDQLEELPKEQLASLRSFTCHRLIDNEEVRMTGDEFWVHLNLQLIHTLDFLPIADWGSGMQYGDPFFQTFPGLFSRPMGGFGIRHRLQAGQTLRGSFSAVSTPIFESKCSLE